ncbi:MAG: flagellar basal-body rod protein FlgG [Syntrophomonadaceae bacterium]|jgi:flagellar basal-body rod protein FlgG
MMRSLYTASTGMYAQQLNVDTLAHNIANVNTTGYKRQRVEFQDLLYQTIKRPTVSDELIEPLGISIGLGVRPSAIDTMNGQGNLLPTGKPLDVAISGGEAYFRVLSSSGEELYTRDGSFKLDAEGNLVTSSGNLLSGVDALEEGAYNIVIDKEGRITYMAPGSDEAQEAGQLELVTFINPSGLEKIGGNLYRATDNAGEAMDWDPEEDGSISLEAGYLEASNVQIVEEMVGLITAQRAYEINSKVIQSVDEMLQTTANLRR